MFHLWKARLDWNSPWVFSLVFCCFVLFWWGRVLVLAICRGGEKQDFILWTEYPARGGRNTPCKVSNFTCGLRLWRTPHLLRIPALHVGPPARSLSLCAAVGLRVESRACLFPEEFQRDTAAGFSVTVCMCTGSFLQPTALHLISVQLLAIRVPGRLAGSFWCRGPLACSPPAVSWSSFNPGRISGVEGKERVWGSWKRRHRRGI